jgi:hypothetical protein
LIQSLGLFLQNASDFTNKVSLSSKSKKSAILTYFDSLAKTVMNSTKLKIIGGELVKLVSGSIT